MLHKLSLMSENSSNTPQSQTLLPTYNSVLAGEYAFPSCYIKKVNRY